MDVMCIDLDKVQPKKKLKQTRLPFKVVNPKIKIGEHSAKKRKLSDSVFEDEDKYIKHSRSNSEECNGDIIVVSDSPSEDKTFEFDSQERDANQPEITNFFQSKDNDSTEHINYTVDSKIKKCYVDLSKSKVDEHNSKYEDDKNANNQLENDQLNSIALEDLSSEDKENRSIELITEQDDSVIDLNHENSDDTVEVDKLIFLQQIGLDDDLNTSCNSIENNKGCHNELIELTPVKNSPSPTKQLTPKQLQRKLEIQKRQEEKERLRNEKLKKQQEEKEKRLKQKQELEEQKKRERDEKEEQKKKEKEEKEEQKRKEREEKERKRQAEIEQKNEDRRKKEQEKLELELKKKKAAEAFVKFFVPKENETKKSDENNKDNNYVTNTTNFMPFQIKSDMRMAPIFRTNFTDEQKLQLENKLNSEINIDNLYLQELKKGKPIGKSEKTWTISSDDVICIDEDIGTENIVQLVPTPQKMRVKLLQFHENRRPPYWGTWRKTSSLIKPRRPLGTDSVIFDYDVDSDDEWEEEEPGESLHGSDDEKDSDCDEKENEYEIDNEFMVPHGYLSEEEIINEEDDNTQSPDSPNAHKAKLKALEIEFEAERREKTERLKPRLFGCIWSNKENKQPDDTPEQIKRFMYNNQILFSDPVILLLKDVNEFVTSPISSKLSTSPKKKRSAIPDKYITDLIRLLHGNTNGKLFLFKEFKAFLNTVENDLLISKKRFDLQLKEIASWAPCPDEGPMHNKYCWYVRKDVREKYNCTVSIPNCWEYITKKQVT